MGFSLSKFNSLSCILTGIVVFGIALQAEERRAPLIFTDLPPNLQSGQATRPSETPQYNPYSRGSSESYYSAEDPSYWRWSQPTFGDYERYSSDRPFDLNTPQQETSSSTTPTAALPQQQERQERTRLPVLWPQQSSAPTTQPQQTAATPQVASPTPEPPRVTPQVIPEVLMRQQPTQQTLPQAESESPSQPVLPVAERSIPLRRLANMGLLDIEGPQGDVELYFNSSPRYRMDRLVLNLSYTSPILIRRNASQLVVKLNDRIAAQIELDPRVPFNRISVPLPIDSLQNGRNKLSLHATLTPVAENSELNLQLQVDAAQSSLEYQGEAQPIVARLSALKDMIATTDPSQPYQFHIAIPESPPLVDHMLRWGALVAQGIALQLPDLNFSLTYGARLKRGMDNIVITRAEYVNLFLPSGASPLVVKGPTISVYALPEDPNHFLLIFTGKTQEDIDELVEAFAQPGFRLPASPSAEIFPELRHYGSERQINEIIYLTERLKNGDDSLPSIAKTHELEFELPPSFDPYTARNGEIRLQVQSGRATTVPGLGFPIFLNNHFLGTALLNQNRSSANGSLSFNMTLDRSLFRPGVNKLKIGHISDGSDGTMLAQSFLRIPTGSQRSRTPDLSDWFTSGYPATSEPDAGAFGVQLTDGDPRTVEAAWTFLAIAARQAGQPFRNAAYSFNPIPTKGHQLIIGLLDQVKPPLGSPLQISEERMVEYTLSPEITTVSQRVENDHWRDRLLHRFSTEPETPRTDTIETHRNKAPGINYRIPYSQFHSSIMVSIPHGEHTSTTILSATSPATLRDSVQVLLQPEIRALFSGDLVVWDPNRPDELVTNTPISRREENILFQESAGFSLGEYQRYIIAGIVLVILLIAGFALLSLLRRAARKVTEDA